MKLILAAILIFFPAFSQAASPQSGQQPQRQVGAAPPQAAAPLPAQRAVPASPDARRVEYEINTLRSMLYQMKSDLSNVKDPAARSALLVDSQMWEWLLAQKQRELNMPGSVRPVPVAPAAPPESPKPPPQ